MGKDRRGKGNVRKRTQSVVILLTSSIPQPEIDGLSIHHHVCRVVIEYCGNILEGEEEREWVCEPQGRPMRWEKWAFISPLSPTQASCAPNNAHQRWAFALHKKALGRKGRGAIRMGLEGEIPLLGRRWSCMKLTDTSYQRHRPPPRHTLSLASHVHFLPSGVSTNQKSAPGTTGKRRATLFGERHTEETNMPPFTPRSFIHPQHSLSTRPAWSGAAPEAVLTEIAESVETTNYEMSQAD